MKKNDQLNELKIDNEKLNTIAGGEEDVEEGETDGKLQTILTGRKAE